MNNPFGKRFGQSEIESEIEERQERLDEINQQLEAHEERMETDGDYADEDHPEVETAEEEKSDLEDAIKELEDLDADDYIHEDEFEDYAQELCEDIEGRDVLNRWPFTCIDWERAADDLQSDYTSVKIGDETYYYRS